MPDNLFKRGNIWYARIQVQGVDSRPSLRTSSLAEAKKRLKKKLAEAEHFRHHKHNRHAWKEAVIEWRKTADEHLKPGVVKRYVVSLNQMRPFLDTLYVDEINRTKMGEIARRKNVSNGTRKRDLTAVSSVLDWCVGSGWCEENVAHQWDRKSIRERRDPIALPAGQDIDAVVSDAPGNFAAMIRWAQYTGMRQEEIAGLERSEINEKRKAADLTKTKTSRARSVPLDERALGTYAGTVPYIGSPYVFWHHNGQRYGNVSSRFALITKRVEAAAKKAGKSFRRFRFHDLRHWYAVDYLRQGGSIYVLQKILGHASIKTTEIYLDFLTPEEQDAAKRAAQIPAQV